jgi:radical SAM protein with 4Fe4S-binding SPASM domain
MGFNIIQKALDFYAKKNKTFPNQAFNFSFYGGEPLFNWKVIKRALLYGNRMMPKKIQWIINTNGTLITQDKARTFFKERVDVHVSIDGPDERTNKNRQFKTGRPVVKKVLAALKILMQNNCQVQFDSCLTMANINDLESLIDLASQNNAHRIYLALIDEPGRQNQAFYPAEKIADQLIEALKYAQTKKIVLGGPWKCFFPLFLPQPKTIVKQQPHLIIDPSGNLSFPSFPEIKFGDVTQIDTISESKAYQTALKKTAAIAKTCRGCDLKNVCSGYLKGMVKYHTGTFKGHERECDLARTVFYKYSRLLENRHAKKCSIDICAHNTSLLETPLIHSRHLKIQIQGNACEIIHGLSGYAINASKDMLEFIQSFKQPRAPCDILNHYHIPDLKKILHIFVKNNILLELTKDEELIFLEEKLAVFPKDRIDTANCICFYSLNHKKIAQRFVHAMELLYINLSPRIHPLRRHLIIYLCQDKKELTEFWFEPLVPPWIKAFIACGRILVADVNGISFVQGPEFQQGMSHEITHILLSDFNVRLPVWLEEGLCEYFSKPDPTQRLLALMRQKPLLTFDQIEQGTKHTLLDIDNSNTRDNICYHQSHSFVLYLCQTFGEKKIFSCIKDMGLTKIFSQAFFENTDKDLKETEQKWRKRLLNLRYQRIQG